MTDLAETRRSYGRLITAAADVSDPRISDAFSTVPREAFVGPGPWQIAAESGYVSTGTADPAVLYRDVLIALIPEKRINSGQPSLHARALAEASLQEGDRVLHVGAGTGYYTAILSRLVGPTGHVDAYEIEPSLATRAAGNLRSFENVVVHARSALEAQERALDVIYVSAALTEIPGSWLDALTTGGRLIIPLTPTHGFGTMWAITKLDATRYGARAFSPVAFIPCVGGNHPRQSDALAAAQTAKSPEHVRSLRRGGQPDPSAWYVGDGWWLSESEP
jgi:protein-L-isoaspartate(D-aspartate) O-methyltransferase